ncbi:MAG: hypothetical protein KL863_15345 [Rhizobium sp.]|nr:hypothetical protein [Rhizobium sp.]
MKMFILAAAVLGFSGSAALADCAYHKKSAQADTSASQSTTQGNRCGRPVGAIQTPPWHRNRSLGSPAMQTERGPAERRASSFLAGCCRADHSAGGMPASIR